MYLMMKGDSLDIAKTLIKSSGLEESLSILKEKNHQGVVEPMALLEQVLALSACNLVQTMKEDFIVLEIMGEDQQDILDDYVIESLRRQKLLKLADGAALMGMCREHVDPVWETP